MGKLKNIYIKQFVKLFLFIPLSIFFFFFELLNDRKFKWNLVTFLRTINVQKSIILWEEWTWPDLISFDIFNFWLVSNTSLPVASNRFLFWKKIGNYAKTHFVEVRRWKSYRKLPRDISFLVYPYFYNPCTLFFGDIKGARKEVKGAVSPRATY